MVAAVAAAALLACTPQPGLGATAYTSGGALTVLELGICRHRALVPRGASGPVRFSHDGNWIAFGDGKVVSVDGGRVTRPLGSASSWAWSPTKDVLAGVTPGGAVVEGRPGGRTIVREPRGWGAESLVWTPDGSSFAVGRAQFHGLPSAKGRQQIVWFTSGERPAAIYSTPRGELAPPLLVGFGGGYGHLFFQADIQNSASIAADGLALEPLETARGMVAGVSPAVNMLPQPGFFTPCGKHVVIAAGGNRNTTTNKRIVVATFDPANDRFRVRNLSRDRTRAWVSPACSPDRTLVAAAAGPDSHDASRIRPRRAIWLLSLDGRTRRRFTRPPSGWSDESPIWSANGKVVLFVRQRLGRGLLYAAGLHGKLNGPLARIDGSLVSSGYATWPVARQAPEQLAMVGCTRRPGLGTVTYVRGTTVRRADLATCRDRVVGHGALQPARPPAALTSPDGTFAATVRVTGKLKTLRNTIWITDRRTGTSRPVYSAGDWGPTSTLTSPGPIELVRWSGDSRWVFFAIDPGGSGSLAADGLILRVVSASGGGAHRLSVMLVRNDYLTWCGGRLVFTAGNGRIATQHKQLDVAAPPNWRARPLVDLPSRAWGSMACAPNNRWVVVQSQPQSDDARFFATRWQLWRVGLDGSHTQLTSPPAQHADESPRFSRDGKAILFVRSRQGNGELYALRDGHLAGPFVALGHQLGYYGHQDWWTNMRWSFAATP
jgi:hypothetical protein